MSRFTLSGEKNVLGLFYVSRGMHGTSRDYWNHMSLTQLHQSTVY